MANVNQLQIPVNKMELLLKLMAQFQKVFYGEYYYFNENFLNIILF